MTFKLHYRATFSILIGSMLLVSREAERGTDRQRQRDIETQRNTDRDRDT